MKRFSRTRFVPLAVLCVCLVGAGTSGVARAGESDDWAALQQLRAEMGYDFIYQQPAAAAQKLQEFYQSRELHPILKAEVVTQVAEITGGRGKKPAEALAMLDEALAQTPPSAQHPETVLLLQGKAAILLDQKKDAEAKTLLTENYATLQTAIESGHPHLILYSSRALFRLVQAQDGARAKGAKPDDDVELLRSVLGQFPVYLDPTRQKSPEWKDGWMYEKLVSSLVEQGKADEALKWGRLYFAEAPFEGKAIENAVKPLNGVWARSGDLAKVRAFTNAQTAAADAENPMVNPLAGVPLPQFDEANTLASELGRLQELQAREAQPARAVTMIDIAIALGRWREAMETAMSLFLQDPASTQGTQQVARVFKAHDSSLVRANAFLAYLEGQGQSPVPAFLAEVDGKKAGGEAP